MRWWWRRRYLRRWVRRLGWWAATDSAEAAEVLGGEGGEEELVDRGDVVLLYVIAHRYPLMKANGGQTCAASASCTINVPGNSPPERDLGLQPHIVSHKTLSLSNC